MVTLHSWKTPASVYPDHRIGAAQVVRTHYKRGWYNAYGVRGLHAYRAARSLPIRVLEIAGKTWMVDDPPHWWAMQEHAEFYSGHVVCAGLGLGLIVHALVENPKVNRITVVERDRDVIDLMKPLIPECEIIHGDFWKYDGSCDGLFYDLFVGDALQLFPEALRTYVVLAEHYPFVRIHGFKNDYFQEVFATIRRPGSNARWLLRNSGGRELGPVEQRVGGENG